MDHNYIFDDFFEETWDYVSEYIVDDDFWEAYPELIREVTFNLYRRQLQQKDVDPKVACKLLEDFFSPLVKHLRSADNGTKYK